MIRMPRRLSTAQRTDADEDRRLPGRLLKRGCSAGFENLPGVRLLFDLGKRRDDRVTQRPVTKSTPDVHLHIGHDVAAEPDGASAGRDILEDRGRMTATLAPRYMR